MRASPYCQSSARFAWPKHIGLPAIVRFQTPPGSRRTRGLQDPQSKRAAAVSWRVRWLPKAYEDGKVDRTVLIEFDSVDQAVAVHDSAAYQAALVLLDGGAVRDLRIVPGT